MANQQSSLHFNDPRAGATVVPPMPTWNTPYSGNPTMTGPSPVVNFQSYNPYQSNQAFAYNNAILPPDSLHMHNMPQSNHNWGQYQGNGFPPPPLPPPPPPLMPPSYFPQFSQHAPAQQTPYPTVPQSVRTSLQTENFIQNKPHQATTTTFATGIQAEKVGALPLDSKTSVTVDYEEGEVLSDTGPLSKIPSLESSATLSAPNTKSRQFKNTIHTNVNGFAAGKDRSSSQRSGKRNDHFKVMRLILMLDLPNGHLYGSRRFATNSESLGRLRHDGSQGGVSSDYPLQKGQKELTSQENTTQSLGVFLLSKVFRLLIYWKVKSKQFTMNCPSRSRQVSLANCIEINILVPEKNIIANALKRRQAISVPRLLKTRQKRIEKEQNFF